MLILWIQTLTLLEDQGLWIQDAALHCYYDKAASASMSRKLVEAVHFI